MTKIGGTRYGKAKMMVLRLFRGLVLLGFGILALGTASAEAGTLISSSYTRVGLGETVTVPFLSPTGIQTHFSNYTGLIEILVSGTGESNTPRVNDAFYDTGYKVVDDQGYFQLNFGTAAAPYQEDHTSNISHTISFIDGVGTVALGTVPDYAPSHVYDFVIQLPDVGPTPLTFGVADGIFGDNTGAYTVKVYQLASLPAAVPESSSLTLIGFGILVLAFLFLSKRRSPHR